MQVQTMLGEKAKLSQPASQDKSQLPPPPPPPGAPATVEAEAEATGAGGEGNADGSTQSEMETKEKNGSGDAGDEDVEGKFDPLDYLALEKAPAPDYISFGTTNITEHLPLLFPPSHR